MSFPRYPSYKDSGVEWLGDVPTHWEVKRLKHNLKLLTEKTDRRDHPVALENIEGWTGRFIATETEFEGEGIAFDAGDILFGKLRPYLAKAYRAETSGEAVGDFHVMRPVDGIDSRFAQYQILNRDFIAIVDGSTFGSKMPRASWDFVSGMKVTTPPREEQSYIAAFLDRETAKIDALVEEQRRLMELLKEKRQAVISHAVTKGLNPHARMKPSGIEWLGDVPAHWDVTPIGHLCSSLSYGFTNPMPETDSGPYMLTANDVDYGKVKYETARKTSHDAYVNDLTEKSRPKKGDVLITKDGTLGRVALHEGQDACINQSVASLRVNQESILPEFMAMCLLAGLYQAKMIYDAGGTTIKHIYISRLAKMPIAYPTVAQQDAILDFLAKELSRFDTLIVETQRAVDLLQERRTALISAAVTGQIDVRSFVSLARAAVNWEVLK